MFQTLTLHRHHLYSAVQIHFFPSHMLPLLLRCLADLSNKSQHTGSGPIAPVEVIGTVATPVFFLPSRKSSLVHRR